MYGGSNFGHFLYGGQILAKFDQNLAFFCMGVSKTQFFCMGGLENAIFCIGVLENAILSYRGGSQNGIFFVWGDLERELVKVTPVKGTPP